MNQIYLAALNYVSLKSISIPKSARLSFQDQNDFPITINILIVINQQVNGRAIQSYSIKRSEKERERDATHKLITWFTIKIPYLKQVKNW